MSQGLRLHDHFLALFPRLQKEADGQGICPAFVEKTITLKIYANFIKKTTRHRAVGLPRRG
ncbi:MAG: hypothetical protein RIR11_2299 [Bacteroidota bacterium]|jgi:hypothetical protein